MKKIIVFILFILILTGCQHQTQKIKVLVPDGIPAVALGGLFNDDAFDFRVVSGADLIASEMVQSNYDIIVAPLTIGAKLYANHTSQYKLKSIVSLGNSYIVARSSTPLESISDLEGKTIAAYGQNNVPDIVLKYALFENGITANIVYESSVNNVLTNRFLVDHPVEYMLVSEPVLSTMIITLDLEIVQLDLQDVLSDSVEMIFQAGLFIHQDIDISESVLEAFAANILLLNEEKTTYVEELLTLDEVKYPSFKRLGRLVLVQSIPQSQIVFIDVTTIKEQLESYFSIIIEYNPLLIGDTLPDEGFYES